MGKILLLGSSSFTGSHILNLLNQKYNIFSVSRTDTDFTFDVFNDDFKKLERYIKDNDFDIVINCISDGDVDSCEVNKELARRINFELVEKIVSIQETLRFKFIHLSTNAVYDGLNPPYSESSPYNPVNYYGKIKAQADEYIVKRSHNYVILRPITMFGFKLTGQRHNPFSFFYDKIISNEEITAVNDVFVNMLFVDDLVKCIESVVDNNISGVFNISGSEVVSRVDFVKRILAYVDNSSSKLTEVSSIDFKTVAARPLNTSFNNKKMICELGVKPTLLNDAISKIIKENKL